LLLSCDLAWLPSSDRTDLGRRKFDYLWDIEVGAVTIARTIARSMIM
jgi:hypothetical protein